MNSSDIYRKISKYKSLYNITAIANIPSIVTHGILCYERARVLAHSSIANKDVQSLRDDVAIPGGLALHQYANLYFDYWNPMLSALRNCNEQICILAVDLAVLDLDDVVVTDSNAASNIAQFIEPKDIAKIPFDRVFARFWIDPDPIRQRLYKLIKCAEVLIPDRIDYKYITGAYVYSQAARKAILASGFNKPVIMHSKAFFPPHNDGGGLSEYPNR